LNVAYVDTSCLVAIAFDEPGARSLARKLRACDCLVASILLESEFRSTLTREGISASADQLLGSVEWVLPDRRLSREIDRVLSHGYVRGADLHHLACALFLVGDGAADSAADSDGLAFYSLDKRQSEVATALGFSIL